MFRLHRICRLLLPMSEASVCQSVCPLVCLSRGSTELHCTKTAKRIKMLFVRNTLGNPWDIVLHWGPDPHSKGKGDPLLNSETSRISGTPEARALKFRVRIDGCLPQPNHAKQVNRDPSGGHVTYFCNRLQIPGTATGRESCACSVCSAFDAASPNYFGLLMSHDLAVFSEVI